MKSPKVLFVCLGNICRSPVAEALFRHRALEAGLDVEVDSAGTGDWHIGAPPQPGSQRIAAANGLDISRLRARQVTPQDFRDFTHIVAMDETNLADLESLAPPDATASLHRMMRFSDRPEAGVLDPYGMDDAAFSTMWDQIESAVDGLIASLRQAH